MFISQYNRKSIFLNWETNGDTRIKFENVRNILKLHLVVNDEISLKIIYSCIYLLIRSINNPMKDNLE